MVAKLTAPKVENIFSPKSPFRAISSTKYATSSSEMLSIIASYASPLKVVFLSYSCDEITNWGSWESECDGFAKGHVICRSRQGLFRILKSWREKNVKHTRVFRVSSARLN